MWRWKCRNIAAFSKMGLCWDSSTWGYHRFPHSGATLDNYHGRHRGRGAIGLLVNKTNRKKILYDFMALLETVLKKLAQSQTCLTWPRTPPPPSKVRHIFKKYFDLLFELYCLWLLFGDELVFSHPKIRRKNLENFQEPSLLEATRNFSKFRPPYL